MKIPRLLAALLVVSSASIVASAQDGDDVASLRAKAEKGNAIAQYNLGLAYVEGRGTTADPLEAYVWLSLARENGARGRDLDALVSNFDRATLATAQQRLNARRSSFFAKSLAATVTRPEPPVATSQAAPPSATPAEDKPALARVRDERDSLSAMLTGLSAELASLRAERENLAAQTAENTQAARETSAALQEKNRVAELARAQQSLAALDQATRELQAAQTELEASRNFGREAEARLKKVAEQKTALEAQLAALTIEADRARQEVAALAKARDEAQAGVTKAEDEAATLKAQLAGLTGAAEKTRQEAAALQGQLAGLTADAEKAKQEVTGLRAAQAELTTRVMAADSANASLQEKLAAASAEAGRARDEAAGLTLAKAAAEQHLAELGPLKPALESTRSQLAASEQLVATLNSRVAELEQQTASLAEIRTAGVAAQKRVADLTAELTALQLEVAQLRQKPAAPEYPDLRDRVRELESQAAADSSVLATAKVEISSTRQELGAAIQAKEEIQRQLAAKPAYPDLSGRVSELESQLTALRDTSGKAADASHARLQELDSQLQAAQGDAQVLGQKLEQTDLAMSQVQASYSALQAEADQLRQRPAAPAYPDLSGKVGELEGQIGALKNAAVAAAQEVADTKTQLVAAQSAAPAYPDLSSRVRELETALAAKPAYPDLSGRVSELEAQVASSAAAAKVERERAQREVDSLTKAKADAEHHATELQAGLTALSTDADNEKQKVAALIKGKEDAQAQVDALQAALAARSKAPVYPDLSDKVHELETQVSSLQAALAAAPAYPDLSGRVGELETALTDTNRLLALERAKPVAAAPGAEVAELRKQLAETEDKLAISLRGFATLEKERDALVQTASKSAEAMTAERNSLTAQVAALNDEVARLKSGAAAQTEALNQAAGLVADKNNLAARLAEVENRAAATQAEADRASQALAALQQSSAQSTTDLAAARALIQRLQDSNSALASENNQLKAMPARPAGTSAPVAAPSAGRTHVVASGDSLSRISQRYYGTANRWQEIYNANRDRIGNEGLLRVGTELRIP